MSNKLTKTILDKAKEGIVVLETTEGLKSWKSMNEDILFVQIVNTKLRQKSF